MRKLFLILLLIDCGACFAQISFQKIMPISILGNDLHRTTDNGFIICGTLKNGSGTDPNGAMIKVDSLGIYEWAFQTIGTSRESFSQCDLVSDGGYIVSGTSESYSNFGPSVNHVIKIDSAGIVQWEKIFGDTGSFSPNSGIKSLPNNQFVLYGTKSTLNGYQPYMAELDSLGNIVWFKGYLVSLQNNFKDIILTQDGGILLAGNNYLIKTDFSGNVIWSEYLSAYGFSLIQIAQTSSGNYAILYASQDSSFIQVTGILSIDTLGNILWNHKFSSLIPADLNPYSFCLAADSGFLISGEFAPIANFSSNYYLIKTDSIGNVNSAYYWSIDNNENISKRIISTSDGGGAFVGGPVFSPLLHFVKFSDFNNISCSNSLPLQTLYDTVSVSSFNPVIFSGLRDSSVTSVQDFIPIFESNYCQNTGITLSKTYHKFSTVPNPAHQLFSIIAENMSVRKIEIRITDMFGHLILSKEENTLIDGNLSSTINVQNIARGIYFLNIKYGEENFVQKLAIE